MKPLSSALIACTLALLTMTASAQTRPCSAAEHRQFDFWLGHWDVFGPAGRKVGENLIQPILNGCALQEDWTSNGNISGRSLNLHDRATGRWHQTWVDSNGGRLELAGGLEAPGRMVLS